MGETTLIDAFCEWIEGFLVRHADQIQNYTIEQVNGPDGDPRSILVEAGPDDLISFDIAFTSNGQFTMNCGYEQDGEYEIGFHYEIVSSPDEFALQLGPHIEDWMKWL